MATAKEVQAALRELLPTLDINTTTERQIREQLAEQLGPVEEHKKLIKQEIDDYLTDSIKQANASGAAAAAAGDDSDDDFEPPAAAAGPGAKRKRASAAAAGGAGAKPAKEPRSSSGSGALPGIQLDEQGLKFATVGEFKGAPRVDLRLYFRSKDSGELAPTRKGVSLDMHMWAALQAALPQLQAAVAAASEDFSAELPNSSIRATASTYQGKYQVGIREYYEDAGELKPGMKGVSLTPEQFKVLMEAVPDINKQLADPGAAPAAAAAKPAAAAAAAAGRSAAAAAPKSGKAAGGAGAGAAAAAVGGGGDDAVEVELGGRKRAAISNFRGIGVDLRETYEKDGKSLPGKKGILLKPEQWTKICEAAGDITAALDRRDTAYKLDLGSKRQVTLSEFRNTWYVGVREFYEKDGKLAPGQKGLSMTKEQWDKLVAGMALINAQLGSN